MNKRKHISSAGFLLVLLALLGIGAMTGCEKPAPDRDIRDLLAQLQNPDRSDSLLREIPHMLFLKQDLPAIYQALELDYPDDAQSMGTQSVLLRVLENVHDESTPGFVEGLLPGYMTHPPLHLAALRVLAAIHSPASLAILGETLSREPGRYPASTAAEILPLIPDSALHHLFPGLFGLSHEKGWQLPVYEALTSTFQANKLPRKTMQDSLPVMLRQYDQLREIRRKQDGKRDAAELESRTCLDLILRSIAHYPVQPEVNRLLVRGMADKDPDLRLSAAFASFEADIPVSDSVMGSLAADFRVRNALFLRLNEQHLDRRFPVHYHTQAAIAESDLATWLANPENSGRFPEEMKFVKKISIENDLATGNVYVFQFRYPGDTWRIGISGPQPPDSTEVRVGGYLTGSLYKTERQIEIDEQVQQLIE